MLALLSHIWLPGYMQLNIFPNNLGSFLELGIYLLCTLSTDDMKIAFFSLITSKIVFVFLLLPIS